MTHGIQPHAAVSPGDRPGSLFVQKILKKRLNISKFIENRRKRSISRALIIVSNLLIKPDIVKIL